MPKCITKMSTILGQSSQVYDIVKVKKNKNKNKVSIIRQIQNIPAKY